MRGEDLTPFLAHPAVTRLRTRLRHLLSPATAVGDAVIGPQLGAHHHYQHTHLGPVAAGQGAGGWDAAGTVAARVAAAGGEEDPWLRRAAEMSCTGACASVCWCWVARVGASLVLARLKQTTWLPVALHMRCLPVAIV